MTDLNAKEQATKLWHIELDLMVYAHCTEFERLPNCIRFVDKHGVFHISDNIPYHATEER